VINKLSSILVLIIALGIAGCDYYVSGVPITDTKNAKIDSNVIGAWASFDNDTLDYAYRIDAIDDKTYILNMIDFDGVTRFDMYNNFVAHSSKVGNEEYMNIRILDGEQKDQYFLFVYELKGDTLTTYTFDKEDFKETFDSSKKFEKYIKANSESFRRQFKPVQHLIKIKPSYK